MKETYINTPSGRIRVYTVNTAVVGTGAAGYNAADCLYEYGQHDIAIVTEHVRAGTSRNTGSDKQTYYKLTLSGSTPDSVREMAQTLFNGQCVDGDTALCEAAAYYKTKGKTLWDAMVDMYEKYGYYKDAIQSITLKGIEGLQKIQEILETLRKNPPSEVGGYRVIRARDYQAGTIRDIATGEEVPTGLPSSNVLYYELTDEAWVCVRPSGTEPKIKYYLFLTEGEGGRKALEESAGRIKEEFQKAL